MAACLVFSFCGYGSKGGQVLAQNDPSAVEFKIVSEVFLDGTAGPVSTNQTLFQNALVFDFLLSASGDDILEAAILDESNQRFVLLDPQREIRLHLDNLQLLQFVEGMRQELQNSEKTAFLVFENAEEDFQPDNGTITVENDFITYRAIGQRPDDDRLLQRYYEFLAHYTRLSTTDPSRLPPFARMGLNRAMKKYGILPREVRLEMRESGYSMAPFAAVSKHRLSRSLDAVDRQRIEKTKKDWMRFRSVGLAEYRNLKSEESLTPSNPAKGVWAKGNYLLR